MLENWNSLKILLQGYVSIIFASEYHKPSSFSNYGLYLTSYNKKVVQGAAAQDAIGKPLPLKALAPQCHHMALIFAVAMELLCLQC